MTPYISHRSTFIIFIISINIVSVVCSLYEPIKENPVIDDNQRKFTYFNYLRAPSQYPAGSPLLQVENLKKLDVDQYYKAYYNDQYWSMPEVNNEHCFSHWKQRHKSYCIQEYVSHSHFVTTYHVAEFGNFMNNLRECLSKSPSFLVLKSCCTLDHSIEERAATCLERLEHREVVTECFDKFKTEVLVLFGKKPEHLKYTEDLDFTEHFVGRRTEIAFRQATSQRIPNEFNDDAFVHLLANYKEFTGDTTYTDDTKEFKKQCINDFAKFDHSVYDKWQSRYNVFKGFDNFDEFSKQIKISIKYLEGLEGKLVNNKILYDKFHKNPISEKDYLELFTPLPLKHEQFYPLYFMRLKFLGYIPVDEPTWNDQINALKMSKGIKTKSPSFMQELGNRLGWAK